MIEDILAKDLADLRKKLIDIMAEQRYFQCDVCTGNYKVTCDDTDIVCPPEQAFDYFMIYFGDKCFVAREKKTDKVRKDELKAVFNTLGEMVTYNSRLEKYNAIPEWDGIPRIDSFMKLVFNCDANPNFFRLYLTAIIGKMKEPEKCYVPYFFDFVGKKGVGKSHLHTFLVGVDHVTYLEPTSRVDDVCTQAYSNNSIVAVDDECVLTGGGANKFIAWSEDKLKAFVTRQFDVFSRKFMQPERRVRSFVFVRTSNEVKSSTDPDERRQIIFESRLPAKECRLWNYGSREFVQLMAEAKDYYEKHGIYKLTKADWAAVEQQQAEYFNDETTHYVIVRKFLEKQIALVNNNPGQLKLARLDGDYIIQWKDFDEYRRDDLRWNETINGRYFWKMMRGLEAKGMPIRITERRHKLFNNNYSTYAIIKQEAIEKEPAPGETVL